ncbi:MAG: rRNA methyltransferase [Bacillales bacterium]|jgi:16S rRNA C1402 N4-methylase RsmH|nr:rRNA methyltransferase [Bacillales bacterium]
MKLDGILPFARVLLEKVVSAGDIAIDCTVGNGKDTVFLANLVGKTGKIYGFDIQELAIMKTTEKLIENDLIKQVSLHLTGHENIKMVLPNEHHNKVRGAIFNLGYLPGGDKEIVTVPETTIKAVQDLLEIMAPEGIIVIVIYHGHPEGEVESDALSYYVKSIPQEKAHVLEYRFINQTNNPPFIIAIEKR